MGGRRLGSGVLQSCCVPWDVIHHEQIQLVLNFIASFVAISNDLEIFDVLELFLYSVQKLLKRAHNT